mmetsp:Transcript_8410/g.23439  ORF Transcript_8410/g.23439 Transcript_8410/m.23439 type:complete len:210 (-) Transcript_8410:438-1067(-)
MHVCVNHTSMEDATLDSIIHLKTLWAEQTLAVNKNWKRRARGGAHEALTLVSTDAVTTHASTVHDSETLHARSCEGKPVRPAKQDPITHQHCHQHLQWMQMRRQWRSPPRQPPRPPRQPPWPPRPSPSPPRPPRPSPSPRPRSPPCPSPRSPSRPSPRPSLLRSCAVTWACPASWLNLSESTKSASVAPFGVLDTVRSTTGCSTPLGEL